MSREDGKLPIGRIMRRVSDGKDFKIIGYGGGQITDGWQSHPLHICVAEDGERVEIGFADFMSLEWESAPGQEPLV